MILMKSEEILWIKNKFKEYKPINFYFYLFCKK